MGKKAKKEFVGRVFTDGVSSQNKKPLHHF